MAVKAMDNGAEDLEVAQGMLQSYSGFAKVKLPSEHLVYSDIYINGTEADILSHTPHFTTGYRFGLPNEDFETDYYPYGSTIIFDEARKYWSARKSMLSYDKGGTHDKTFEAFELSRQNGLNIIMVTQLINHIDLNIRSLCHKVIEPYEIEQRQVGKKLVYTQTIWKCRVYEGVNEYELAKNGNKNVVVENIEYIYNGDIFECYDTEFFRFKYLHGLRKYTSLQLKPCDGSRKSVKKLYELYGNLSTNYKAKSKQSEIQRPRRVVTSYL